MILGFSDKKNSNDFLLVRCFFPAWIFYENVTSSLSSSSRSISFFQSIFFLSFLNIDGFFSYLFIHSFLNSFFLLYGINHFDYRRIYHPPTHTEWKKKSLYNITLFITIMVFYFISLSFHLFFHLVNGLESSNIIIIII